MKRLEIGDVVEMESNINDNKEDTVDRSKVRILLCDNDAKSSGEILALLSNCYYQVTSVRTPRQVVDALNAEGPDIDIILAEVNLPIAKGLKMLKYIMRDKDLRRIPIIMMSAQDEVSVVIKCLRLGAADYLVKPLRTNELLNLWTHMWRRRRMLGLTEKKNLNYDFDLVASDPSDANTNSTTLFSDDTDDKSRKSHLPDVNMWSHREEESNDAVSMKPSMRSSFEYHPNVPGSIEQTGNFISFPKKSQLKIGESSAFLTYVKSSIPQRISERVGCVDGSVTKPDHSRREKKHRSLSKQVGVDAQSHESSEIQENYSGNGLPGSGSGPETTYVERCTPVTLEFPQGKNSSEEQLPKALMHESNKAQVNPSGVAPLTHLPYYMSGMMNQVMMPQLYQANLHDLPKHATSTMMPHYNSIPQCSPHLPMMAPPFPYYPFHVCIQPGGGVGQIPAGQVWSSIARSSSIEVKPTRVERREAALMKFRQKRKDRCFDKKIRYINRKRLAERRPRVRGQFVRQVNGVDVDLNGWPVTIEDFEEEEEDEEELVSLEGDA